MSFWHEIENKEDVDTSEDFNELHILYKNDLQGNYYVSVPVEFVLEALGVDGQSPRDDKGSTGDEVNVDVGLQDGEGLKEKILKIFNNNGLHRSDSGDYLHFDSWDEVADAIVKEAGKS